MYNGEFIAGRGCTPEQVLVELGPVLGIELREVRGRVRGSAPWAGRFKRRPRRRPRRIRGKALGPSLRRSGARRADGTRWRPASAPRRRQAALGHLLPWMPHPTRGSHRRSVRCLLAHRSPEPMLGYDQRRRPPLLRRRHWLPWCCRRLDRVGTDTSCNAAPPDGPRCSSRGLLSSAIAGARSCWVCQVGRLPFASNILDRNDASTDHGIAHPRLAQPAPV
mmetsp:Transcript_51882/g.151051  ORF Transcript_51882/g.151051 Transcript_51882/m.151051 type:complete len:221 (+) Transcript_51882:570-1232(+)